MVFAFITPVSLQVIAYGLGRVAATWLRKGKDLATSDRTLLIVCGAVATVAVLAVVFGVMQRMSVLQGVEGGAHINPALFYALFLILPLGLGVAEILKHDEFVAVHNLRSAAYDHAAAQVGAAVGDGRNSADDKERVAIVDEAWLDPDYPDVADTPSARLR